MERDSRMSNLVNCHCCGHSRRFWSYTLHRILPDDAVVELSGVEVHGDLALCNYIFVPQSELQQFRQRFRLVTPPVAA
jgi:hypothetical protein